MYKISEIDEKSMYKKLLQKNAEAKKGQFLVISANFSENLNRESAGAANSMRIPIPSPKRDIFSQHQYQDAESSVHMSNSRHGS